MLPVVLVAVAFIALLISYPWHVLAISTVLYLATLRSVTCPGSARWRRRKPQLNLQRRPQRAATSKKVLSRRCRSPNWRGRRG